MQPRAATHRGRAPSAEATRGGIIRLDQLIIRATKMPNMDSAMVDRLSKHRSGDGGRKDSNSSDNSESVGHGGLHLS